VIDQVVETQKAQVRIRRINNQSAEPTVLIHGLGASGHNWFPFMEHFKTELDMTAVDLPGFGNSLPPKDLDHSPKNFAKIISEVIDQVYPDQAVHLLGNSLGGAVAVQLAARNISQVKSLTLVSPALPTFYPHLSAAPVLLSALPNFGEKLMKKYLELPAPERAKNTIQTTFADPNNAPDNWLEAITKELAARDDQSHQLDSMLSSLRSLLNTFFDRTQENPWNLIKQITAPTLFVYGKRDKLVHYRAWKKAREYSPSAVVKVWPDTGHVAHIEHSERLAKEFSQNLLRNLASY
jgi:pimeloyl-ACP methyl ester carboxylesterase